MEAASPSKAAKIWRRTWVGLSIGGVAITCLVLAANSADGAIIAIVATALTFGAAIELARMGDLREQGIVYALLGPVLAGIFLCWDLVSNAPTHKPLGLVAPRASLLLELAVAATLAFAGWSGHRLLANARMRGAVFDTSLVIAIVVVSYIVADGLYNLSVGTRTAVYGVGLVASLGVALAFSGSAPRDVLRIGLLALWIALPLGWLWHVWDRFGGGGIVALVVLSKVGDIAAYYGGNAFGKHHPLPNLSPGKTVEGFACSAAAGLLTGAIMAAVGAIEASIPGGLAAGLIVNVAAQSGDLFESWVKRSSRVKDSSGLFGPSGGVLDVVDSLLFTSPAALLTWPWILVGGTTAAGV